MRFHVEQAFGWDETFQRENFVRKVKHSHCTVISVGSAFAGFTWVDDEGDRWFVRLVCLKPEFQGVGIGSAWLQRFLEQARSAHRDVRLSVLKTNRAKALYDRLGFRVTATTTNGHEMVFDQWRVGEATR